MLRVFLQSIRITGFGDRKTSIGQYQVGKGEQGKKLCSVLGQAAIARLMMTEQVLASRCLSSTGAFPDHVCRPYSWSTVARRLG